MKKILSLALAALGLVACSTKESKTLIIYYSQTGTTEKVATQIQKLTGADIVSIDATMPYDGTYAETIARCQSEMAKGELPELNGIDFDIEKYDTVFLGAPIWFGTCALPMLSLLETVDFTGKTLVPFCSFGSGGLNAYAKEIANHEPEAYVREGYGVRTARADAIEDEVYRFLVKGEWIKGEVSEYDDFSEQMPVTEEEAAIFDTACSGYQFPLGTPVSCGSRKIDGGTEYMFIAASASPDGSQSQSTIYVIAPDGGKAEFTQVVR